MFFDTTEYYQNIDKGRPSYQRKAKKCRPFRAPEGIEKNYKG